jgi:hypothetical protein
MNTVINWMSNPTNTKASTFVLCAVIAIITIALAAAVIIFEDSIKHRSKRK